MKNVTAKKLHNRKGCSCYRGFITFITSVVCWQMWWIHNSQWRHYAAIHAAHSVYTTHPHCQWPECTGPVNEWM